MLRFLFCIRDEHETLVATLDMWKFRVVTEPPGLAAHQLEEEAAEQDVESGGHATRDTEP